MPPDAEGDAAPALVKAGLPVATSGQGTPLVVAHGFTQTGELWGEFGALLARARTVVAVDLPGHGRAGTIRADLPTGAALLADTLRSLGTEPVRGPDGPSSTGGPSTAGTAGPLSPVPVDLLGYSMGARFALRTALDHPEVVARLVLISGTPGIADVDARRARRARDEALADRLEGSGHLDDFLDRWLAAPMFATLPASARRLEGRRRNTPAGLASSLRLAGTGVEAAQWGRLTGLVRPVLLVAGATDPRFARLGAAMAAAIPDATFTQVPGAGHAVHLEAPRRTAVVVEHWLGATGR